MLRDEFADPSLAVTATSGVINQQGRAFNHGFEIHLEKATLLFEFAVMGDDARYFCKPTLLDDSGQAIEPELAGGDPLDAFETEIGHVVESVESGQPSAILGAEFARDAIEICRMQTESLRTGARVEIQS